MFFFDILLKKSSVYLPCIKNSTLNKECAVLLCLFVFIIFITMSYLTYLSSKYGDIYIYLAKDTLHILDFVLDNDTYQRI